MKNKINIQILEALRARHQTLATAESCTGGLLAAFLVNAPSASVSFLGGIIAYAEYSKIHVLDINPRAIQKHGVVSEHIAALMALEVKKKFNTHWGISTTGFSGPTGGTKEAPLGTLVVGVSGPQGTKVQKFLLKNLSREEHQQKSCEIALKLCFDILLKN